MPRVSATALVSGWAADMLLGDPRRWHPVAGFGRAAEAVEAAVYAPSRRRGAAYAGALVGLAGLAAELVTRSLRLPRSLALAAVAWLALGGRSLVREARRIALYVERGELAPARSALPALVGRDTTRLEADAICRAAVESVAENTSDAVVGTLVWGALAGPGGVAAHRAANTLDAMVGNRSARYREFGWAAARLDDLISWPAARAGTALTALCSPLVGGTPRRTWSVVVRDGRAHPSPNAGPMEAAFAGALGVRLGGSLAYGGRAEERPLLGAEGRVPEAADIDRAARLSLAVGAVAAGACAVLARVIA